MAVNLREKAEADLQVSLEGAWGLPVVLIDPAGNRIDTSENTGDPLTGQVLFDTVRVNPDTGDNMVIGNPVVTLRRSSLSRIPAPGERWLVKIPASSSTTAALDDFIIDSSRAPEGGKSIGFIRLYLRRAKQT